MRMTIRRRSSSSCATSLQHAYVLTKSCCSATSTPVLMTWHSAWKGVIGRHGLGKAKSVIIWWVMRAFCFARISYSPICKQQPIAPLARRMGDARCFFYFTCVLCRHIVVVVRSRSLIFHAFCARSFCLQQPLTLAQQLLFYISFLFAYFALSRLRPRSAYTLN